MYSDVKKRKLIILAITIFFFICLIIILFSLRLNKKSPINKDYLKNNEEKRVEPTASVIYDNTELTNQDVTVKLTDINTEIIITNNDGKDTFTFTENGEFTFNYVNKYGDIGSTTAKVDWIDKTPPIALISFGPSKNNPNYMIATLTSIGEEIIVLNNDGKNYYEFTENGQFKFIYQDQAGNINSTIAEINCLDNSLTTFSENPNFSQANSFHSNETNKDLIEEETKKPTPKIDKSEEKEESDVEKSKSKKNFNIYIKSFLIIDIILLFIFLIIIFCKKIKIKSL